MKKDISYHGDVIIFDLDDTLIKERDYCREGFRRIEKILTDPESFSNLIEKERVEITADFKGISHSLNAILEQRGKYFDYLEKRLREKGLLDRLPELIQTYRNNEEAHIELKAGMVDLLECLSARGVILGIISDGRSLTQRMKIKAAGLEKYFDPGNILISEETGKDKSVPDNFRHFVSRYPEARRFFYIADNERKDFIIPNILGWQTYKVRWDHDNVHEDYQNPDKMSRPAFQMGTPSEFANEIKAKGNV